MVFAFASDTSVLQDRKTSKMERILLSISFYRHTGYKTRIDSGGNPPNGFHGHSLSSYLFPLQLLYTIINTADIISFLYRYVTPHFIYPVDSRRLFEFSHQASRGDISSIESLNFHSKLKLALQQFHPRVGVHALACFSFMPKWVQLWASSIESRTGR